MGIGFFFKRYPHNLGTDSISSYNSHLPYPHSTPSKANDLEELSFSIVGSFDDASNYGNCYADRVQLVYDHSYVK